MKKLFSTIVVLGLLLSGNAHSEWTKISSSDGAILYFDPVSITKDQGSKYVWILIDQKIKENDAMSRKVHLQIQCGKGRYLIHQINLYEDNLGLGKIVSSVIDKSNLGGWRSAIPDSLVYPVIKKICN
ncbi:hypothetical protein OAU69_03105 [Candidatus Pelagibacter sp.]|nr:hypothetical protein [Candidatus Pelagibacter sp.]